MRRRDRQGVGAVGNVALAVVKDLKYKLMIVVLCQYLAGCGQIAPQQVAATTVTTTQADGQVIEQEMRAYALDQSPTHLQAVLAIAAGNPAIAPHVSALIASAMQLNAQKSPGQQGGADAFAAGVGVTPFGSTMTGQRSALAADALIAHITSAATIAAANISAKAAISMSEADNRQRKPENVTPPN